ncbi:hypothetical protein BS50DRAFT_634326 [Corynespora cassiicola Philippines]|uniref:Heavy metal tolerance protein n=1 Tax=Corynespora cassiicola Philippines TaxID=1448308 RepID=A0A2T2NN74_CORCC|nr:hypothetical protein BS50DRAFT_634326 [Corynespora cassiicola Philippines]
MALSPLIWAVTYLVFYDAAVVYKVPNVGAWILATTFELVILVSPARTRDVPKVAIYARRITQCLRIATMLSLCVVASLALHHTQDGEMEPLLRPRKTPHLSDNTREINDEEDNTTKQDQQNQRLEDLGGWWAYAKEFRIFIPQLVPFKDGKLQLYIVGVIFLTLVDRASNLLGPLLIGELINQVSQLRETGQLPWKTIVLLIFIIKIPHDQILVPLRRRMNLHLYWWRYRQLFITSFAHVMSLSLDFHENKKNGEVLASIEQSKSMNDVMDSMVENLIPFVLDIFVAVTYLTYLFDVYFGLILTWSLVGYGVVTYKTTLWAAPQRRKWRNLSRAQLNICLEAISNWQNAHYNNRQEHQLRCVQEATKEEIQGMSKQYDISQISNALKELVITLAYCAILLLASYRVVNDGQPVGNMVTILLYWGIISKPMHLFAFWYGNIVNFMIDAEPLLQHSKLQPTVRDCHGAPDLKFKQGQVEFRNISFSYDGRNSVIKGLSFTVQPGSTVALVGRTGSGKTTTCEKLLFRGYDVNKGSILIDGQDIRHVTQKSLRDTLGIVRQTPSFLNDSILNNMRFARLDATDSEIIEACKNAAMHDQILAFPQGYDTVIGEGGVKLSGGGKQRLAIAQLFLRDPKIVVLDEATSTVDNVTEYEIQDAFSRVYRGRTTFIVAHRLSTVQHADQILVLDQGSIIERGTHTELLALRGAYYDLWTKKSSEKRLEKALEFIRSDETKCASVSPNPSIAQLDGQSPTKPFLKAAHHFKSPLHKGKNPASPPLYNEEPSTPEEPPMHIVSPKPTITSLDDTPPPKRRFSLRRREHAAPKESPGPSFISQKQTPAERPAFRPASTQSSIPLPDPMMSPFSSPERDMGTAMGTRSLRRGSAVKGLGYGDGNGGVRRVEEGNAKD